jgi:hypothetical protein
MSPTEISQRILNGKWRHASAALRACQRGAWPEFARKAAPPRPLLLSRLDHRRCLELAERSLTGPVTTKLTLVPLWACSTAEVVSTEWVAVHGVAQEGQPLQLQEVAPFITVDDASPRADAPWECAVRRWTAATVVDSDSYALAVPMLLRAGAFGVLELQVYEVLSVDLRETEPVPRPTREVPIFSSWFEPRARVSPELESRIRAMCHTSNDEAD